MAKNTQRDRIWITALNDDEFSKHEILERVDAGNRTVHDVLKTMVDAGFLSETEERRHVERGESGMYTGVTVYKSLTETVEETETDEPDEPDVSHVDEAKVRDKTEEIGVGNGDVSAQPHGSSDDKPDSRASDTGERVESDSETDDNGIKPDEIPESWGSEYSGAGTIANIDGIGEVRAEALVDAGYESLNDLFQASKEELTDVKGVGEHSAKLTKRMVARLAINEYEIPIERVANTSIEDIADICNLSEDIARRIRGNAKTGALLGRSYAPAG